MCITNNNLNEKGPSQRFSCCTIFILTVYTFSFKQQKESYGRRDLENVNKRTITSIVEPWCVERQSRYLYPPRQHIASLLPQQILLILTMQREPGSFLLAARPRLMIMRGKLPQKVLKRINPGENCRVQFISIFSITSLSGTKKHAHKYVLVI